MTHIYKSWLASCRGHGNLCAAETCSLLRSLHPTESGVLQLLLCAAHFQWIMDVSIHGFLKLKTQSFCMESTGVVWSPHRNVPCSVCFLPACAIIWETEFIPESCFPLSLACTWLSFDSSVVSTHPISPAWSPQHWWFLPLLAKPVAVTSLHPPVSGGCFSKGIFGLTLQNKPKGVFPFCLFKAHNWGVALWA